MSVTPVCTILVAWRPGAAEALVLAANRDEFRRRPADEPFAIAPGVFAGRDRRAGGTWLAVGQNVLGGRSSLAERLFGGANQALERGVRGRQDLDRSMAGNELATRAMRSAGRTDLGERGIDRTLGAMGARLNLFNSGSQSSVLNPHLNENTMGYYPGVSAAGAGLQNAGNTAGTLAGFLMYPDLFRMSQTRNP